MRFLLAFLILTPWPLYAQGVETPAQSPAPDDQASFWDRFWVSVQGSFATAAQDATSRVETLYTGFRITNGLEIFADLESAGGAGLSSALGIAGFPNVDVVRNPTLGEAPYFARAMLHYIIR